MTLLPKYACETAEFTRATSAAIGKASREHGEKDDGAELGVSLHDGEASGAFDKIAQLMDSEFHNVIVRGRHSAVSSQRRDNEKKALGRKNPRRFSKSGYGVSQMLDNVNHSDHVET